MSTKTAFAYSTGQQVKPGHRVMVAGKAGVGIVKGFTPKRVLIMWEEEAISKQTSSLPFGIGIQQYPICPAKLTLVTE